MGTQIGAAPPPRGQRACPDSKETASTQGAGKAGRPPPGGTPDGLQLPTQGMRGACGSGMRVGLPGDPEDPMCRVFQKGTSASPASGGVP